MVRGSKNRFFFYLLCFPPHFEIRFCLENTADTVKLLFCIFSDLTKNIIFRYTIVNLILFYVLQDTICTMYNVNVY